MWNKFSQGLAAALLVVGVIWVASATAGESPSSTAAPKEAASADGWKFEVGIYGWMPAIKGETVNGNDIDISFNDILDNLDFTFMSIIGASKGKWSLMVDLIYLDLSADDAGTVTVPLTDRISVTENVKADVGMQSWVVTPTVGYNLIDNEKINFNILAGARYLWIKTDLEIKRANRFRYREHKFSYSGDVWDGIVGVRGNVPLTDKWYLPYYLDIGTGQTDFTWQVFGGVGYRFKYCDLVAGYRYLEWNSNDSDALDNLNISGPLVGVKFVF